MSKTELSFEIFPTTKETAVNRLYQALDQMHLLDPAYISVTCSNAKHDISETTLKFADYVQNNLKTESIAHLPAAYLSKETVSVLLKELQGCGVDKVLALRGDIYPDKEPCGDFQYASQLISFIKEVAPQMKISAACYPEGHPEAQNVVTDLQYLKNKVDCGAEQLITQLFFENECFYRFQERCLLTGIDVPITAGIMPIINKGQIERILSTSQVGLPKKYAAILARFGDSPEVLKEAGIAYAVDQIVDLVTNGVEGIHLYTMNNAEVTTRIVEATKALFTIPRVAAVS